MRSGFFAIDKRVWPKVCDLGLNEAVVYLVLACGTERDQQTTTWSVHAIEKYTQISRPRAKAALDRLIQESLVMLLRSGTKPQYFLAHPKAVPELERSPSDWIWLPNSLVVGVKQEVPPVDRIRRLHDVMTLRLFIELYGAQSLPADSGIDWRIISRRYLRERVGEAGRLWFWRFMEDSTSIANTHFFSAYATSTDAGKWDKFWCMWDDLERLGLMECVPHLVDGDGVDAEIIHPCPDESVERPTGTSVELKLGAAARLASFVLANDITRMKIEKEYGDLLAVSDDFPRVQMVGIFRLTYRPHTRATAAWHSRESEWDALADRFQELARTGATSVSVDRHPTSFATSKKLNGNQS